MEWETIEKNDVITCPQCHGAHIRISRMIEQIYYQIDNRKMLQEEHNDYDEPILYTCLDEKCGHDWTSEDTED